MEMLFESRSGWSQIHSVPFPSPPQALWLYDDKEGQENYDSGNNSKITANRYWDIMVGEATF